MKAFMIGGTCLLGSEAARELIARGHEVLSVALPPLPEGAEKLGVQPDDIEAAITDSMELCKAIMEKKVNSISMRGE